MWKNRKPRLRTKIIVLILILVAIIISQTSILFYFMMSNTIETQIGKRALSVAKAVAWMPEIRRAFGTKEPWKIIQPIVEKIRKETDAEFIVVGNEHGVRYSHPIEERIGKEMVGGDNSKALIYGESYVSKSVGTLGPSLRGKVPIFDDRGKVIGIVSVGFLIDDIKELVDYYGSRILWIALTGLIIGIIGSIFLARSIKKSIYGLEPEEISALYEERDAVIQSVREGIVVVNKQGTISLFNQTALDILSLPKDTRVIGKPVLEIIPNSSMLGILQSGEEQLDREMDLLGKKIIANRLPVKAGNEVIGVVSSFRLKSEIDQLTEELSQVKLYMDALRAQTHEYNNMLYTISGLLQLESYHEALELIHKENAVHQDMVQFVMKNLHDPWLGGILIGFYNRSRELKVEFMLDRESSISMLPHHIDGSHLVSILGNLITNAFEAVEQKSLGEKWIRLFITDIGEDLILEVEDSGKGIDSMIISNLFKRGFTTKAGEKRGYGLARVKELVDVMGGSITIEEGEWGGALFTVAIPKERGGYIARTY